MVALMLVPTAAIFASILLAISIWAKSYKEASGLISPLMMLVIVPIVVAMLPGVELNWFWSMVPLTNVSLAMKELVKGTMDYRMFAAILLSTTLMARRPAGLVPLVVQPRRSPVPQLSPGSAATISQSGVRPQFCKNCRIEV
ncbi:hypothetical protein LP419_13210 [Massilia sp. H-1]|nr:hypothetical protein LP419_13210 [Massilia sp. H-1]